MSTMSTMSFRTVRHGVSLVYFGSLLVVLSFPCRLASNHRWFSAADSCRRDRCSCRTYHGHCHGVSGHNIVFGSAG